MQTHLICNTVSLREALEQMENYHIKFLIIVDLNGIARGTLTDGDIRRALLRGASLNETVDQSMCQIFSWIEQHDGLPQVLTKFQDTNLDFLPVLDKDRKVVNIITRRAFQVLLLKNEAFHTDFDFNSLQSHNLEHNIVAKPWGFYKTTVLNEVYQTKVLYIMPGAQLSLQSHKRREEYWIVVNGNGKIQLGQSTRSVSAGSMFFIPKGCKHRVSNISEDETLIITEVQLGDYFGEDDIERYEDIYHRI